MANGILIYTVLVDRLALVVGGGKVAARKVRLLSGSQCRVRVVAPQMHESIIVDECRLRAFKEEDLDGASLVFAATNSATVNRDVATLARARGIPVNVADDPEYCDFYLPAMLRQGDLQVAVSTGGTCPGFAALMRRTLQPAVGPELQKALQIAASARRWGREHGRQWENVLKPELIELCRQDDADSLNKFLAEALAPNITMDVLGLDEE